MTDVSSAIKNEGAKTVNASNSSPHLTSEAESRFPSEGSVAQTSENVKAESKEAENPIPEETGVKATQTYKTFMV